MSTREAILTAAARHLNQHPTASIAEIAAAAGVGRATLHRHFASREALLTDLGVRSLDRWQESQDAAGVDDAAESGDAAVLAACLEDLLARYVADSDEYGFVLTDAHLVSVASLRDRSDRLEQREVAFLAAAQRAGVLRDDVPAQWLSHAIYGLLVAARDADLRGTVARRDLDHLVITSYLTGGAAR